jgi:hypothetical protein
VESEEGRGSTFSFAIPVLRRESEEDSTRLQTAKETRP